MLQATNTKNQQQQQSPNKQNHELSACGLSLHLQVFVQMEAFRIIGSNNAVLEYIFQMPF